MQTMQILDIHMFLAEKQSVNARYSVLYLNMDISQGAILSYDLILRSIPISVLCYQNHTVFTSKNRSVIELCLSMACLQMFWFNKCMDIWKCIICGKKYFPLVSRME